MSVCRRETDEVVTVAVALTYSTNHLIPLHVCYMVMLMSLLQDLSEVNPPKYRKEFLVTVGKAQQKRN